MRILHTADWHVGKRIGRYDRLDEYRQVIEEVVAVADDHDVDLVLHSGDLFDVPRPPVEALAVGLDGLLRLAAGGRRPVVVIAGNHDSGELFEVLAPLLRPLGVHLVGEIRRPDEGGVLELETAAGPAVVACFPFLREGRVIDLGDDAGSWYGQYADKVRRICEVLAEHTTRVRTDDGVAFLLAHFLVSGAVPRTGLPRGERPLHLGEAYTAQPQAVPAGFDYVALGHIHAPQPVPGVRSAAYAGSLLQLDFGEAGEEKRALVVDVSPGKAAKPKSVPLGSGRPLVRRTGTWAELVSDDTLREAWLDLTVVTEGPDPELGEKAREQFPHLVRVTPDYPRLETEAPPVRYRDLVEAYGDFYRQEVGQDPPAGLVEALRRVEETVDAAT